MGTGKRRLNREGSIWQRRDGRWTGAAYVLTTSGVFKRVYVYGHTRDDVHTKLVRLQAESDRGIPRPDRASKVGEYLDCWLASVAKPAIRPTTYAKYETMVRLYLRPGLGRHRLDRLSVPTAQAFFNSRLSAGDSIAKVHVMRVVLSAALTRAMREELVSRNVARLVTLPPAPVLDRRPWSVEEARRFLQTARRDPLYAAFTFLLAYGLRRGEVLGLSWNDVNFDQGVIHIRRQMVRAGGRLHLGPVKTTAGVRELPLLAIASEALIEHEANQLLGKPATKWDRERLIFTTASGQPVEPRNIGRSFERIVRKAGLRPIRLHDLRHTTASLLKKLSVSPRDAMVILGHSNISVTLGIYTHGDEDSQRDALERLDQALRLRARATAPGQSDTAVAVTSSVTQDDPRVREDQG
jgi:integrase